MTLYNVMGTVQGNITLCPPARSFCGRQPGSTPFVGRCCAQNDTTHRKHTHRAQYHFCCFVAVAQAHGKIRSGNDAIFTLPKQAPTHNHLVFIKHGYPGTPHTQPSPTHAHAPAHKTLAAHPRTHATRRYATRSVFTARYTSQR
jgi:hypothetical protein